MRKREGKQIIINKNHYDTDYYDATTEEAFQASVKKIYAYNKEMTYYHSLTNKGLKEEVARMEKDNVYYQEKVDLLKKHGRDTRQEEEFIKRNQTWMKELKEQKKYFDKAEQGDVVAMEKLLRLRSDYDSEGFDLVTLG